MEGFLSVFVSVVHEVEEDMVEFSWKRNRLFNHTACLVLYQICMEVCACLSSYPRIYVSFSYKLITQIHNCHRKTQVVFQPG